MGGAVLLVEDEHVDAVPVTAIDIRAIAKNRAPESIDPTSLHLLQTSKQFTVVGIASTRTRPRSGEDQRQRRNHRHRPPLGHVRRPHRTAPQRGHWSGTIACWRWQGDARLLTVRAGNLP